MNRLLIIDDDVDLCELLSEYLSVEGFTVAMAHMFGQFAIAYLLFIPHDGLWRLFPVLMTVAVFLGIINGIISQKLVTRLTPLAESLIDKKPAD